MTTIVTRAGKGSALTHNEVDANFTNLQTTADAAAVAASTLAQFGATTSAQLAGVISDETGSGALVFANTPTLVTPVLGTPGSGTLTNCTGLPVAGLSDATANGRSLISAANYAAMRALLDLEAGTDFNAYDAELAAIAGLTSAADRGIMFTGSGTAAVFTLTAAGLALLDDAAASNQRTTLGLGTSATMDEATDAQVRAATADKVVTAELIESASAFVALTSTSNSIAIDWDSGINFSHTFTENTIFANPTNGQPGTWRTIRTTQHASSPKTIGVGTQYHSVGAAAVSTTATNSAVDHYTIMCITSSLFVIFQSLNIADVP